MDPLKSLVGGCARSSGLCYRLPALYDDFLNYCSNFAPLVLSFQQLLKLSLSLFASFQEPRSIYRISSVDMTIPFGFSVGDFNSTIELIHDIFEALKDSDGSKQNFQALMRELYSLERALLAVKALERSPTPSSAVNAIKQAAMQCQVTVDAFLQKNQKYFSTLSASGHSKNPSSRASELICINTTRTQPFLTFDDRLVLIRAIWA